MEIYYRNIAVNFGIFRYCKKTSVYYNIKVNIFTAEEGFYGKRKIKITSGVYSHIGRLCYRCGKRMEISVHVRWILRSRIYFNLLIVLIDHGYSGYGLRIFHWTRKQEECSYGIWTAGASGHFLASDEIYWYFRLLSSDDVLHDGWRLDDVLLF